MKVLVVGAGMYVTGKGTQGLGTILPALVQSSKAMAIERADVVATQRSNGALVDRVASRLNAMLGASLPVGYHTLDGDLRALVRKLRPDCAIVSIPDHLHFDAAKTLLDEAVHVQVVKPLVPTTAELRQLLQAQRATGALACVEFHKRFDETNLWVKRAIAEKRLGELSHINVEYSQRIGIPLDVFSAWAARTNIFQYLGVHYVDLIYFLTGARPVRLLATGTKNRLLAAGMDTYDHVHATIVWESPNQKQPFHSHLTIGWIDPRETSALSDQSYRVVGTEARIDCDQKNRGLQLVESGKGVVEVNPYFSDFLYDAGGELEFQGYGFRSLHTFLRDCERIAAGTLSAAALERKRATFKDSAVSVAVIEAANRSLATDSQWVAIDDLA